MIKQLYLVLLFLWTIKYYLKRYLILTTYKIALSYGKHHKTQSKSNKTLVIKSILYKPWLILDWSSIS